MTRPISTHDIDLAAASMTITGEQPSICIHPGDTLATFNLPDGAITQQLCNDYATGNLTLNIKRFSSCRAFLFKKIKGAQ